MRISVLLPFLTFILSVASAQDVVVSEYFNEVNPEQEWTEILVIKDDMNLVGYHVTDHEGQHERRIGGFTFRDVALWRHVRAGTIIVVFHRDVPANTRRDDNPDDGFLQFSKFDAAVFDPFLAADGPNINQDRDYIEILRPDSTHVHGLGHGNPGPVYVNSPRPKVLLDTGVIGGNRAPGIIGRSLAAYDADRTRDSAALTIGGSRGLPNQYDLPRTLQGFVSRNHLLWRELRQPTWSAAPTITIGSQTARSTEISWTPVTDVHPADGVTGVMILRDTNAFVGFPSALIRDGVNFGVGQSIGTAEVLAFVPTRDGTRFVDSNNVRCGARYTYRTYAYRFRPDDLLLPSQTPDSSAPDGSGLTASLDNHKQLQSRHHKSLSFQHLGLRFAQVTHSQYQQLLVRESRTMSGIVMDRLHNLSGQRVSSYHSQEHIDFVFWVKVDVFLKVMTLSLHHYQLQMFRFHQVCHK